MVWGKHGKLLVAFGNAVVITLNLSSRNNKKFAVVIHLLYFVAKITDFQPRKFLFFLANIPTIIPHSWSTGITERYLPLQYYTHTEVPGLDKSCMCVGDLLEIISFRN